MAKENKTDILKSDKTDIAFLQLLSRRLHLLPINGTQGRYLALAYTASGMVNSANFGGPHDMSAATRQHWLCPAFGTVRSREKVILRH